MTTKEIATASRDTSQLLNLRSQVSMAQSAVHELGTETSRLGLLDAQQALLDAGAALRKAKVAVTLAELAALCTVYDNGGKTLDRYTVFSTLMNPDECLGLSEKPTHAQGFSQMGNGAQGDHLGKQIAFTDLPYNVQVHVAFRLGEL